MMNTNLFTFMRLRQSPSKNHPRRSPRQVGELHSMDPAEHQNLMPRTSLFVIKHLGTEEVTYSLAVSFLNILEQ